MYMSASILLYTYITHTHKDTLCTYKGDLLGRYIDSSQIITTTAVWETFLTVLVCYNTKTTHIAML